jgi:N-acetyl-anhydromuramyl-L-alanine amidase AmpD
MANDPQKYQFDLSDNGRPTDLIIPEAWYPGIRNYWPGCTTQRDVHPIDGIKAVVIHATAGGSSEGAISVMKEGKSSFHWLVPGETESQHGKLIWACVPETLAAWHVRNDKSHSDVNNGKVRVNHWSLGIEIVNTQTGSDSFSDWQVTITAKIIRYCWSKYPNLRHVVSHAKLDPQRRSDPGIKFPWEKFKDLVLTSDEVEPFSSLLNSTRNADDINIGESDSSCCVL